MTREEALQHMYAEMPTNKNCCAYEAYQMAIKALEAEPCDDAISRKALLDAIYQKEYGQDYNDNLNVFNLRYVDIIKGLPSVAPERKEPPKVIRKEGIEYCKYCIHAEMCSWYGYEGCEWQNNGMGDVISRQDALNAFGLSENTRKYGGDHSGYDTMMLYEIQDVLEDLPSVSLQPTCNKVATELQPCEDCISREAAKKGIEELIRSRLKWVSDSREQIQGLNAALCEIEDLLSVKPERKKGKWIDASGSWSINLHCDKCDVCVHEYYRFCPNCGAEMETK